MTLDYLDKLCRNSGCNKAYLRETESSSEAVRVRGGRIIYAESGSEHVFQVRVLGEGKMAYYQSAGISGIEEIEPLVKCLLDGTAVKTVPSDSIAWKSQRTAKPVFDEELPVTDIESAIGWCDEISSCLQCSSQKLLLSVTKKHFCNRLLAYQGEESQYGSTILSIGAHLLSNGNTHNVNGRKILANKIISDHSKIECSLREIVEEFKTNLLPELTSYDEPVHVIISPKMVLAFISLLTRNLRADKIEKEDNPFRNLMGKAFFNRELTVYDDPIKPLWARSYAFDYEGVVPRRVTLINKGIFHDVISDTLSAHNLGVHSSGHSGLDWRGVSSPAFSNICVEPGMEHISAAFDKKCCIIEEVRELLYVPPSFPIVRGIIEMASIWQDGEQIGIIRNIPVTINLYKLFENAVPSAETRGVEGFMMPWIDTGINMTVKGKGCELFII